MRTCERLMGFLEKNPLGGGDFALF